jgi:hypothetical protein
LGVAVVAFDRTPSAPPEADKLAESAAFASRETPIVEIPKVVSEATRHLYSIAEDGEYGYEQGISEDDRKRGTVAKALLMVRYLGIDQGTYTLRTSDDGMVGLFSCSSPCDFVKNRFYVRGALIKVETLKNSPGSILWAATQDAMSGQLKPFAGNKQPEPQPAADAPPEVADTSREESSTPIPQKTSQ